MKLHVPDPAPIQDFTGRTAFVTGGANGIGLALARALLAKGCKVAIADIREEALEAALAALNSAHVMPVKLDVSSRAAFAEAADSVERTLGPVSLLFNNAGVNLFLSIDESTYEDWDWVLGVNLHGVIHGVMTFVPRMKELEHGSHIVNTGSMVSFLCGAIPGIYNTSKFAVRAISESLRYSLAEHRIGVSMLCPGLVNTEIYKSYELHPAARGQTGRAPPSRPGLNLVELHKLGMEPALVARAVLEGIQENRFYIFSHPEHKSELREVFDEILAAYPDGEAPPPGRAKFETWRRAAFRDQRVRAGIAPRESAREAGALRDNGRDTKGTSLPYR